MNLVGVVGEVEEIFQGSISLRLFELYSWLKAKNLVPEE